MDHIIDKNPEGNNVLKVAIFFLGGIRTPQDFQSFTSSNIPPLRAVAVRSAKKNFGR